MEEGGESTGAKVTALLMIAREILFMTFSTIPQYELSSYDV